MALPITVRCSFLVFIFSVTGRCYKSHLPQWTWRSIGDVTMTACSLPLSLLLTTCENNKYNKSCGSSPCNADRVVARRLLLNIPESHSCFGGPPKKKNLPLVQFYPHRFPATSGFVCLFCMFVCFPESCNF